MRRFLRHIVERRLEGRSGELKETLIGIEVFDRDPSYDPKSDAIVRVEARRLRAKLAEYYAGPGVLDPVRVVLPKGSYVPEFETAPAAAAVQPVPAVEPAPAVAPPRSKPGIWWAAAFAVVLIAGLALAFSMRARRTERSVIPFTSLPGYERKPAFSPDGNSIAFGWAGPGRATTSIYVQRIGSDEATQITFGPGNEVAAAWSPDGRTIAFWRHEQGAAWAVMTVPSGGGAARKLAGVSTPFADEPNLSWSAGGDYLLTSTRIGPQSQPVLVRVTVSNGEMQPLPGSQPGDTFPQFAPNGGSVAYIHLGPAGGHIFVAPSLNGSVQMDRARRITKEPSTLAGFDWLPGSREIVYSSDRRGPTQLWRVRSDGGEPQLIPEAPHEALTPAVSRGGNRLAWVYRFRDMNIWSVRPDGTERKLVVSSTAEDLNPDVSPDGARLAFSSNRTGSAEIWTSATDGSAPLRLTRFGAGRALEPRWSPDGGTVVFVVGLGEKTAIYTVPARGGPPARFFESDCQLSAPAWSLDAKWIYYSADCAGKRQIRKRAYPSGPEVVVAAAGGASPSEQPDGYLYYFRSGIVRMPVTGGAEESVGHEMGDWAWGNWAIRSGGVYHVHYHGIAPPATLEFFDFAERRDREVLRFDEQPVRWQRTLAASPDGKQIFYTQLDRASADIQLMENFK
jgi:Tol biopolymer transport system component